MIFHCFGWFVRWKEESKAVTQKFEQTVNELRWEFFVFCLVILWKMQKPIMTLSSCKAMKDFHSNLKFTSVALGHLRTSYQTFPNFDSSLLSHLIAWLLIAWLFQFTAPSLSTDDHKTLVLQNARQNGSTSFAFLISGNCCEPLW